MLGTRFKRRWIVALALVAPVVGGGGFVGFVTAGTFVTLVFWIIVSELKSTCGRNEWRCFAGRSVRASASDAIDKCKLSIVFTRMLAGIPVVISGGDGDLPGRSERGTGSGLARQRGFACLRFRNTESFAE